MSYIYRDAVTGRIVTKKYAEAHPETTVREAVEPAAGTKEAHRPLNKQVHPQNKEND